MEKVIYDEKKGLWYELQGDYYIPCLKLSEEEQQPVDVWGQRTYGTSSKTARYYS